MICILGDSHAPRIFREAAKKKGLELCDNSNKADLIVIAQDTPTDTKGNRDLDYLGVQIRTLASMWPKKALLVTSQVPVGFMRSLGIERIWHMAETLRIKDALERAMKPEQIILGGPLGRLPYPLTHYVEKWGAPVIRCSWEEAEFSKIAINNMLIAQVEMARKLKSAALLRGDIDWKVIQRVLQNDKRIGPHAYLEGGNWRDSIHLLRDHVTLESM